MFINNNFSDITGDCIHISYCNIDRRNRIRDGIWRCNRSDIVCNVYNQVNIKKVKIKSLREIVGSYFFLKWRI